MTQYFSSPSLPNYKNKVGAFASIYDVETKCSALQVFVNNLRNCSVRVKMTDGESGLLISFADLDDCLAKLAKRFIEKSNNDINSKYETFAMVTQSLNQQIERRNTENKSLQIYNNHLKEGVEKMAEALFNQKGSALIFEVDALLRELTQMRANLNEMEQRLREKVKGEVASEIERLHVELEIKDQRFKDFQLKIAAFVKGELKISSNNINSHFRRRIGNILNISSKDKELTKESSKELQTKPVKEREVSHYIFFNSVLIA